MVLDDLASVYAAQGNSARPSHYLERALAINEKRSPRSHRGTQS